MWTNDSPTTSGNNKLHKLVTFHPRKKKVAPVCYPTREVFHHFLYWQEMGRNPSNWGHRPQDGLNPYPLSVQKCLQIRQDLWKTVQVYTMFSRILIFHYIYCPITVKEERKQIRNWQLEFFFSYFFRWGWWGVSIMKSHMMSFKDWKAEHLKRIGLI